MILLNFVLWSTGPPQLQEECVPVQEPAKVLLLRHGQLSGPCGRQGRDMLIADATPPGSAHTSLGPKVAFNVG